MSVRVRSLVDSVAFIEPCGRGGLGVALPGFPCNPSTKKKFLAHLPNPTDWVGGGCVCVFVCVGLCMYGRYEGDGSRRPSARASSC